MMRDVDAELLGLEPLFHHAKTGAKREYFEALMAADFWETGASGNVYTKEFVLDCLVARYSRPHDDPWEIRDFQTRQLSEDLWLVTYTLAQGQRLTRRVTLWRYIPAGWRAEYHQGTLIACG